MLGSVALLVQTCGGQTTPNTQRERSRTHDQPQSHRVGHSTTSTELHTSLPHPSPSNRPNAALQRHQPTLAAHRGQSSPQPWLAGCSTGHWSRVRRLERPICIVESQRPGPPQPMRRCKAAGMRGGAGRSGREVRAGNNDNAAALDRGKDRGPVGVCSRGDASVAAAGSQHLAGRSLEGEHAVAGSLCDRGAGGGVQAQRADGVCR